MKVPQEAEEACRGRPYGVCECEKCYKKLAIKQKVIKQIKMKGIFNLENSNHNIKVIFFDAGGVLFKTNFKADSRT